MKRFFNDFRKYFRYAIYSARCALNAEVAGSYLNWLWWIFNPFCMMIIYTLVFGVIFNAREKYFPVFIFIGLSLWDYFNRTVSSSIRLVKSNKAIVTKVYLPKFVLIVTTMMVNFIKLLFAFGVIVVMMIVFRVPVSFQVLWIIPILAIISVFTFGISTLVMHFGVFVDDLYNIVKIILRFVFYATGIFYSIPKRITNPTVNYYMLHFNPMAYFIDSARKVLIYREAPDYQWMLIWLAVSIGISALGIFEIYRYENSYAKVI